MSRKDTIIIAVLVNAGLLIILFASALKSTPATQELAAASNSSLTETPIKSESVFSPASTETPSTPLKPLTQLALAPAVSPSLPASATPTQALNFVDDLKSIATPQLPPALRAVAESKNDAPYSEIKVKKGDMLEKIAKQHHTSVQEIIALNQLSSPSSLRIGQTLKIPSGSATAAAVATSTSPEPKYYVVKAGDNPWTIAVKNHMKVDELLKLNHLDQEKARKLKPGDKLRVK